MGPPPPSPPQKKKYIVKLGQGRRRIQSTLQKFQSPPVLSPYKIWMLCVCVSQVFVRCPKIWGRWPPPLRQGAYLTVQKHAPPPLPTCVSVPNLTLSVMGVSIGDPKGFGSAGVPPLWIGMADPLNTRPLPLPPHVLPCRTWAFQVKRTVRAYVRIVGRRLLRLIVIHSKRTGLTLCHFERRFPDSSGRV